MFDTEPELLEHIKLGGDTFLEMKRVFWDRGRVEAPDARSIADEISAMANTFGGVIVFGVDDKTHDISQMTASELDIVETWLQRICFDTITPPMQCAFRRIAVNGGGIICVDIPKSLYVHKGGHGYFGRFGSSKRELTPDMLARLFQQKSQSRIICFDEQIVPLASRSDLKPALYNKFRTPLSENDETLFLKKLHFLAEDMDTGLHPTVGGILMASEHPEEYLPGAFIQAVAYRGLRRHASEQLDARDITGPLDVQVMEALHFVKRNMRIYAVKSPARMDMPQFSLAAVFEALVNSVAHRDYSINGAKIRIHIFSDRLEIFSPGGLPNSLTLDEISERQFTRNELLCTTIARCKLTEAIQNVTRDTLMDRRGEGVPCILEYGLLLSGKKPLYEVIDGADVKLTLYATPGESPKLLSEIAAKLTENQTDLASRLKNLMRSTPQITQQQMASICNVSRSTVAFAIVKLKEAGDIERIGSDRKGRWVVYR